MSEPFRVVCADPPWPFEDSLPGPSRGAEKNYSMLSVDQIVRLVLPPIADDALLFLWRVSAMQEEALQVVRAWGFELKSEIVWRKKTVTGKRWFGMGRYVRAEHETCLIARRGSPQIMSRSVRSTFSAKALEHSVKPEVFYMLVEELADGPYLELFARRTRPGWTCLGEALGTPHAVKE